MELCINLLTMMKDEKKVSDARNINNSLLLKIVK